MKKIGSVVSNFISTHKQMWVFSYLIIYLGWWKWLEDRSYVRYHVIHSAVDDAIPFCEYFIIPYLAWFAYIPLVFLFFLLADHEKKEFYQYTIILYAGMTFFLIFSTVYPNVQYLRPAVFEHQNFCTSLVRMLYRSDTSTNIFPSIHVYNSVVAHMAVCHSRLINKHSREIRALTGMVSISIVLSTMFLKQHSVIDVLGGLVLAFLMDQVVYRKDYEAQGMRVRQRTKRIA